MNNNTDKNNNTPDEKPDLKHDTMEFAASTEGDELLDEKDLEDDDLISGEELEMLEDEPEAEAAALNAVETDLLTDEDNLPEEDWLDDIPGGDAEDENDDEQERS